MLAVYITGPGKPDVVQIRQAPDPKPRPGQALVRVEAAGLNYAEIVIRKGMYPDVPKFPFIPGYEFSGVVERNNGCTKIGEGDRVIGVTMFGAQAEYIAIDEAQLIRMPANMSYKQAAAIPVNYLTAYYALFRLGNLRQGEKVLIHSCAGGVGTAAVQLALTRKAELFGTTSREEKMEYLKKIGVHHPINYRQDNFRTIIADKTESKGVNLTLDPVGGATFRKSYKALASGGRIISYGVADLMAGSRFNLPRLLWKFVTFPAVRTLNLIQSNKGVFGLSLNRLLDNPDNIQSAMAELLELFEKGSINPEISKVYNFKEAAQAHKHLESGESIGKLILKFTK